MEVDDDNTTDLYFENSFWNMKLEDFDDITEFPLTTQSLPGDLVRPKKDTIEWKYPRHKPTEKLVVFTTTNKKTNFEVKTSSEGTIKELIKKQIAMDFFPKKNLSELTNLDMNDKMILEDFATINCGGLCIFSSTTIKEIASHTQTTSRKELQTPISDRSTVKTTTKNPKQNKRHKQNAKGVHSSTTTIKETRSTTHEKRVSPETSPSLFPKQSSKKHHNRVHKPKKIATTRKVFKATTQTLKLKAEKEHPNTNTCDLTDFNRRNKGCICSIQALIKSLRKKIKNEDFRNVLDTYTCPDFTKIETIVMDKGTQPLTRKRRSHFFFTRPKREIVENANIDKFLGAEPHLINTDSVIYGKLGERVLIPCTPISSDVEDYDNPSYLWKFTGTNPLKAPKKGVLEIHKISLEDAGKYTCTLSYSNADVNETKKFEHELSVIALPIFSVKNPILYNMTKKCELKDTDEVAVYLPKILGKYVCGSNDFKMCHVEVPHPQCVNKDDKKYLFLTLTYTMQPLDLILPSINATICDNNCQMKAFSKMTSILVQNVEVVEKLPVISRIHGDGPNYTPTPAVKKKNTSEFFTKEPELSITCPGGFGLQQKQLRVCVVCPKNTYNDGDDTCKSCPVGQYQPNVGSKSCLTCTSPLQDPACLRIMYTNTKTFRVYVGCAFGVLISLIILLACCGTTKKDTKHKKRDVREMEDMRPLMKTTKKRKRGKSPPKPPPPDF